MQPTFGRSASCLARRFSQSGIIDTDHGLMKCNSADHCDLGNRLLSIIVVVLHHVLRFRDGFLTLAWGTASAYSPSFFKPKA